MSTTLEHPEPIKATIAITAEEAAERGARMDNLMSGAEATQCLGCHPDKIIIPAIKAV